MRLQVPLDDLREKRYRFLETHRMPSELRRKLSREQLEQMLPVNAEWSAADGMIQSMAESCSSPPTWKLEHLRQVYHRKTKLWSGSIVRRSKKPEQTRQATALDISRSLGVTNTTPDQYYKVTDSPETEYSPDISDSRLDIHGAPNLSINHGELIVKNSEGLVFSTRNYPTSSKRGNTRRKPIQQGWRSYSQLSITPLTTSSKQEADDVPEGAQVSTAKLPSFTNNKKDFKRIHHRDVCTAVAQKLRGNEAILHRKRLNLVKPVVDAVKPLPAVTNEPKRLVQNPTSTVEKSSANHRTDGEELETSCVRIPVLSCQTHLVDIMGTCKGLLQRGTPNSTQEEGNSNCVHKYPGDQMLINIAGYDIFARRQKRK